MSDDRNERSGPSETTERVVMDDITAPTTEALEPTPPSAPTKALASGGGGGGDDHDDGGPIGGPIAWMARNTVAANLLMFMILIGGAAGALSIKQEVFPEFTIDVVRVTVPYPGASPAEVEQGIILVAEEAVRGVDGVKLVSSVASENSGTVAAELLLNADPDKVLNDIKSAIDRITSFPELAERPVVKLVSRRREVISLIISGEQELQALHDLGEMARMELLQDERVTQIDLFGVPPVEIAIELSREGLEKYGLTSQDVARAVAVNSLELPGGEIETRAGEILVRVADRAKQGQEFGELVLKSTRGGGMIKLRDVATIRDDYADNDAFNAYNGKNAVRLTAYRIGDETPTSVATAVKEYSEILQDKVGDQITVATWNDQSEMLEARIDLLLNNAWVGLLLVLFILALFLDLRLAFWVGLGIPISFMGAFLLMPTFGLSVNMVTLFAFIVTLGLVVDDAIIVGEHAFHKMQEGMLPMRAAIEGAREMAMPVTFAVLTTAAAFSPLLFIPGVMGKIFKFIPLVVIAVLLFSVIEGFFILPAHVGHVNLHKPLPFIFRPLEWANKHVTRGLARFIDGVYRPFAELAVSWRYATMATALASFFVAVGIVGAGLVPFNFFPVLEGDIVKATVRLPYGAPESLGLAAKSKLEQGARDTLEAMGGDDYLRGMYSRLGEGSPIGGPGGGATETGSHMVSMEVNLVPSDERPFQAEAFAAKWRESVGDIVGARSMVFDASSGPGAGAAVDVQLTHVDNDVLGDASNVLADKLRDYKELTNIENTFASGKPQLDFTLKPEARALGLTASDLALQLRTSFFGAEALREQRGRNEMKVMVRLQASQRQSEYDLEQLRIRTPTGALVPIDYVAEFSRSRSPTSINREEGRRTVNVQARLAKGVPSPRPVLEDLRATVLPELVERYPGLSWKFVGAQRAQGESLEALRKNFLLALFVIFTLLAIPFRSYMQPFVVMSAIPFGFVGAVLGHLFMGFELSIISMMGVVALAGVVVNDSLVLIDAANGKRREGWSAHDAIIYGGTRRFRPILLTSLTTFFGLMPMIFETDMQARFLIPMAISLGFGVLFATLIALVVVPALYMILEDVIDRWAWLANLLRDDEIAPELQHAAGGERRR
jgi:multidrug efflux pump subunit AcrB